MNVIAINFSQLIAICSDNSIVEIEKMFGFDGEEVDDVSIAFTAVVPLPNGKYEVIEFSDFEPVMLS